MSFINSLFLALLSVAVFMNKDNRRGQVWLALLAFNYAVSCVYWRLQLPHPEFAVGCLDAIVCAAILRWGDEMWELWLCRLFQTSLLAGILYLFNNIFGLGLIDHTFYSIVMEVIMGSALIMVIGVGAWQWNGLTDARAFHPWPHLHRSIIPLYRQGPRDPR